MNNILFAVGGFILGVVITFMIAGGSSSDSSAVTPQQMSDAVHKVLEADRTVYTQKIVNRLTQEKKVIKASEHWKDEDALLLPAQMFRAGAELVQKTGSGFSYALLSSWPINKQNEPKTDVEKEGLQVVVDTGNPFYKEETLGNKRYFTAVYPDKAIAKACVTCHNEHKDTPKKDFKFGDVMGGVVIRIPLES